MLHMVFGLQGDLEKKKKNQTSIFIFAISHPNLMCDLWFARWPKKLKKQSDKQFIGTTICEIFSHVSLMELNIKGKVL
jgi:hypothetical protein